MDDGERLLTAMYKLLIVFLILDSPQSREYQRALTMSIHLWEWMRVNDHAGWRIFRQNASAFNEESGEIAFSVLARDLASSGIRSDVKSVSRKFGMIKAKMTVAKGLEVELCGDGFSTHDHCVVKVKSPEVDATVAFFKGMIRKLHRSCHHHYSSDCGHLDAKDRRNAAPRKMIAAMVLDPLRLQTSQSQVEDVAAGLKLKLHQFWVYPFRDVWPAAQPSLPDGPDSSSSTDDEVEQKSEQDRTVRRRRRLKRTRRSDPIPAAVIDDDGDAKNFIGRVVSCPSWCIGIAWSRQRYGSTAASKKARIHGVLSESTKADNHRCIFYNDSFPDIDLTLRQVQKWVVDIDNEVCVEDTPFLHPEETSTE
jgi:hypothetical protein